MDKELSMDNTFINKLTDILEVNLENEQFGVNELAGEVGLSRSQLHRKLHAINGKSTTQFIREYRLGKAMEMLKGDLATASEIAYRVGFNSPTYFNTSFKEYYGFPPGEVKYRVEKSKQSIGDISENMDKIPWIGKPSAKKLSMVVLGSLGLLLIVFFIVNAVSKDDSHTETKEAGVRVSSIAVLPFKNLSDAKESEYFTAGVTQSIQNHLNKIPGLKLISETSMAQYEETTKTSPEIAAELNVSHLLEASVQEYDDKVRVIVKLIDAKKDEQIWSDSYDRDLVDIFNIQSEISKQIASALEVVLSPTQMTQIDRIPTNDIEAYNLYQKGKHFFNLKTHSHGKGEKSVHYYKQAIEKDPDFALAYAALATAYLNSGQNLYVGDSVELVEKLALKAIALDSSISEAHVALGTLAHMYEWNWEKAQKEYQRAIELNPNNSNAYIYYSQFLFSVRGEFQEARKHIEKALQLDPLSYVANLKSAYYYFYDGNYDRTFEETSKLKEINRHNMYSYWINFETYSSQGVNDKAVSELVAYFEMAPVDYISIDSLKIAHDLDGRKGVHRYYNERNLHKFGSTSNFNDFSLYADAQRYGHIGNDEKTLEYLEIALERRCSYLYEIKYDPYFNGIRSEPRFYAILEQMHLGSYN